MNADNVQCYFLNAHCVLCVAITTRFVDMNGMKNLATNFSRVRKWVVAHDKIFNCRVEFLNLITYLILVFYLSNAFNLSKTFYLSEVFYASKIF